MKYLFAASAAFLFLAAACGGGSSDPTPAPAIATAPGTVAPTAIPTAAAVPSPTAATTTAGSPTATTSPTAVATPATTPAPTPVPASTPPPASAETITITAHDLSFEKSEVHVRVGTRVTAVFQNTDAGTDHNLTFNLPGLEHPTCTGPCTTTQNFTVSTAGKFAFFCTIHAQMFGDFFIDA